MVYCKNSHYCCGIFLFFDFPIICLSDTVRIYDILKKWLNNGIYRWCSILKNHIIGQLFPSEFFLINISFWLFPYHMFIGYCQKSRHWTFCYIFYRTFFSENPIIPRLFARLLFVEFFLIYLFHHINFKGLRRLSETFLY